MFGFIYWFGNDKKSEESNDSLFDKESYNSDSFFEETGCQIDSSLRTHLFEQTLSTNERAKNINVNPQQCDKRWYIPECNDIKNQHDSRDGFQPVHQFPSAGGGFEQARQEVARNNFTQTYIEGKTFVRTLAVISNLWTVTNSFCPPYDFSIPELREEYLKIYQLFPDEIFEDVNHDISTGQARATPTLNQNFRSKGADVSLFLMTSK